MIELSVQHLKKSFEVGEILLDDLSFEIRTGECVGIMGRNGCGKTTLFRIITGEIPSDGGEVIIAPGRRIGRAGDPPERDRRPSGRRYVPVRTDGSL